MKIVVPLFGLGNVMFQYAFLCELRYRYPNEACINGVKKFDVKRIVDQWEDVFRSFESRV